MRKLFCSLAIALIPATAAFADVESLDRGHQLLIKHGLQIQAWVFPGWKVPGVPHSFNMAAWEESNLTAPTFMPASGSVGDYVGTAPGIPWGKSGGYDDLSAAEAPYASNLVSVQLGDEHDLTDPDIFNQTVTRIINWKERYPNTIVFNSQWGTQFTDEVMLSYMAAAQPDMLMFDAYPFNGLETFVPGGSPSILYYHLGNWRRLALLGNDGTGTRPIPMGLHTQTFTAPNGIEDHIVTESELRLNRFSAYVYGYTYINCFFYDQPGLNNEGLETVLFSGPNDTYPTTALFDQLAELNRQSLNLGPALVRLLTTDVRFKLGRHKLSPSSAPEPIVKFFGMETWSAGQTVPHLTSVETTNLGTENYGLEGNVILGGFRVLEESLDGAAYGDQAYFMVVNGLSSKELTGTAAATRQRIHLTFDFGSSGITALQRMSRDTGLVEDVALVPEGGSVYSLELELDGGTGDLFKFKTGAPFAGDPSFAGDITCSHAYIVEVGERVEFEATPGGGGYHWYRDGVELSDDEHIQGSTTQVLVLYPAAKEDTGVYVCRIDMPELGETQAVSSPYEILVIAPDELPLTSAALALLVVSIAAASGMVVLRRTH